MHLPASIVVAQMNIILLLAWKDSSVHGQNPYSTSSNGLMVCLRLIHFPVNIVCNHVSSESDYGDTETREEIAEHCSVGKNRMFAPGVSLCPGIAK